METKKRSTTWKKGDPSPNPAGRKKMKHSVRTVKGMVERFIKRNITPNKLQALYDGLKPKEKLDFLIELMPYCAPKQSAVSIDGPFAELSDTDLHKLYDRVLGTVTIDGVLDTKDEPKETLLLNTANFNRFGQE